jgi:hypothetical protein
MTAATREISIDDIVPLTEAPQGERRRQQPMRLVATGYAIRRRGLLRAVMGAGTVAGISALGLLPGAREASAACISALENYISGPCPVNVGDCSPACGPSMVYLPACDGNQWHKWTGSYRNRPDSCNGVAEADGWRWYGPSGGCGCPAGAIRAYRCHDGCTNFGGTWTNTICRQTASGCLFI